MANILRTAKARLDLKEIWHHVSADNPPAATALLRRIQRKVATLADYPYMGLDRPELGNDLRSLPVGSYVIFYRPLEGGIEIVRVLHGAMDVPAHFSSKD